MLNFKVLRCNCIYP